MQTQFIILKLNNISYIPPEKLANVWKNNNNKKWLQKAETKILKKTLEPEKQRKIMESFGEGKPQIRWTNVVWICYCIGITLNRGFHIQRKENNLSRLQVFNGAAFFPTTLSLVFSICVRAWIRMPYSRGKKRRLKGSSRCAAPRGRPQWSNRVPRSVMFGEETICHTVTGKWRWEGG